MRRQKHGHEPNSAELSSLIGGRTGSAIVPLKLQPLLLLKMLGKEKVQTDFGVTVVLHELETNVHFSSPHFFFSSCGVVKACESIFAFLFRIKPRSMKNEKS